MSSPTACQVFICLIGISIMVSSLEGKEAPDQCASKVTVRQNAWQEKWLHFKCGCANDGEVWTNVRGGVSSECMEDCFRSKVCSKSDRNVSAIHEHQKSCCSYCKGKLGMIRKYRSCGLADPTPSPTLSKMQMKACVPSLDDMGETYDEWIFVKCRECPHTSRAWISLNRISPKGSLITCLKKQNQTCSMDTNAQEWAEATLSTCCALSNGTYSLTSDGYADCTSNEAQATPTPTPERECSPTINDDQLGNGDWIQVSTYCSHYTSDWVSVSPAVRDCMTQNLRNSSQMCTPSKDITVWLDSVAPTACTDCEAVYENGEYRTCKSTPLEFTHENHFVFFDILHEIWDSVDTIVNDRCAFNRWTGISIRNVLCSPIRVLKIAWAIFKRTYLFILGFFAQRLYAYSLEIMQTEGGRQAVGAMVHFVRNKLRWYLQICSQYINLQNFFCANVRAHLPVSCISKNNDEKLYV